MQSNLGIISKLISRLTMTFIVSLFCDLNSVQANLCSIHFTNMSERARTQVREYLTSGDKKNSISSEAIQHFQAAFQYDPKLKRAFQKLGFSFDPHQVIIPRWIDVYNHFAKAVAHIPEEQRILPAIVLENRSNGTIRFFRPGIDPWPQDGEYDIHTGQLTHEEFESALANGQFPTNFSGLHDISHLTGFLSDPENYMTMIRRLFNEKANIENGKDQAQLIFRELHFVTELLSLPNPENKQEILNEIKFDPNLLENKDNPKEVIEHYKNLDWSEIEAMVIELNQRTTGTIAKYGGIVAHPPEVQINLEFMIPVIINQLQGEPIYSYQRKTGDEMAYNSISLMAAEIEYLLILSGYSLPELQKLLPGLNVSKNQIDLRIRELIARFHWSLWYGSQFLDIQSYMNDMFFNKNPESETFNYIRGMRGKEARLFRLLSE